MVERNVNVISSMPRVSNAHSLPPPLWFGEMDHTDILVELPYWIMCEDFGIDIEVNGHSFKIELKEDYACYYIGEISVHHTGIIYIGPANVPEGSAVRQFIQDNQSRVISRHCHTVARIHTRCSRETLKSYLDEDEYSSLALLYLRALCEAHIELLNQVVRSYRLASYDFFAHFLATADVPIWYILTVEGFIRVDVFPYELVEDNPISPIIPTNFTANQSLEPHDLQDAIDAPVYVEERELIDAMSMFTRGDYTGASRRVVTAIEVIVESVLRAELLKRYSASDTDQRLFNSRNDFPGRLRQYQRLSGRRIDPRLDAELDSIRILRHDIVHGGKRLEFSDKAQARHVIEVGREVFEWVENDPSRQARRNRGLRLGSLQLEQNPFSAQLTADGVVVHHNRQST